MAREGNEKIWKVAVLGAAGRMGSEAVRAVNTSADMDLVAALGRGDDRAGAGRCWCRDLLLT